MAARLFDNPDDEDRIARQIEFRRAQNAARVIDPALVARTADIRRQAQLGPSSLAFAKSGRSGSDPLVQRAATAKAHAREKRGFGLHSIGDVLKGTVRTAMTALESPLQEVTGFAADLAASGPAGGAVGGAGVGAAAGAAIGSIIPGPGTALGAGVGAAIGALGGAVGASHVEGDADFGLQSTGAIAAGQALHGEEVDLGTGFFSGGEVREEHVRRANEVQVGGKAFTGGRLVTSSVIEPGNLPYNVLSGLLDASVAIKADPAALALRPVRGLEQSRRLFVTDADVAGLVAGTRRTVLTDRVGEWLAGDGQRVVSKLADTGDTYDVWKMLGRKVDPEVAARIADAATPTEVEDILRPMLGVELREKPQLPGAIAGTASDVGTAAFRAVFRRSPQSVRLLQTMPGGSFMLDDTTQSVTQMERFLRNARMPDDMVADYVDRLARAASPAEKYRVIVTDMLGDVMGRLSGQAGAQKAKKVTTVWRDNYRELTKYFVDEIGENIGLKQVTIGGRQFEVPTPHLYTEYIHSAIPSPDARAIRRLTSGSDRGVGGLWSKAVNSTGWEATTNVLDFLSQDVWKPFALLRGAWTVRVVGEEQVRMAASGLDSIVSHPLRAIAWATGRAERGNVDVLGQEFDALDDMSDFGRSLSQRGGNWRSRIVSHGKTVVHRGDDFDRYVQGWQGELGQLAADPVAKRVAGGWSPGDGVPGGLTGNHVDDAKRWFFDGAGQKFRKEMAASSGQNDLLIRSNADAYIDSVFKRIRIKTSDDATLIDAIGSGKLNGKALEDVAVRGDLQALAAADIGPEFAKADITLAGRPTHGSKVGEYLNQATDFLFTNLMSKETNWLSRSPTFRQYYYQRLTELVPYMDDATKTSVIAGTRRAGLDEIAGNMEKLVGRGAGNLDLAQADLVAKGFGLDATKQLLFDLSEKSQAADIARIVFPFAEAWREILTRWSRIGIQNPVAIRRGQQAIEGARGAGWFATDPATGEEVFNYPATGFLSKKLFGVPAPLQGSVAALNLFSNNPFVPGFGPVVQVTVGKMIPDKPAWDTVRNVITPYGQADTGDGFVESFLPAWVQKWRTAMDDPESDRQFANTVMDVARYLVSTGDYSTSSVAEQERLSAAAVQKARAMYLFRGAAQWIAPSAPRPEMMAADKEGNLVTAFKLTEEFRKLQDENYETAVQRFLDTYGEQALLYMQPKSRGGFTPTDELHEWVRANPTLANRYKDTYGYFAPTGGEFSITEMDRQVATGQREALTPKQAVALANARVAAAKYRAARERVGAQPSSGQRTWLRDVRDALVAEYPGYEPEKVELGSVDGQIHELRAAVREPVLAQTDTGRALAKYFTARDQAVNAAKAKGLAGFGRANSMRSVRSWLRDIAEALAAEHPDFLPVYERVLEREMVDDTKEANVA